ncbi:MCP four helix bundle domain-containing protein, partial [Sphingobacterium shayense]|uniref:MCP four helix bundle domain-containing protein n=1 Tax=Sphingobacterium shayense TaxID=626343 RepID=UPI00155380ED
MWTFAIKQKMTAAVLLFAVIVLVMLTNMREQRTAKRISTAVTSLYEDRLVVAQYIHQLSKQMDGIIYVLEKEKTEDSIQINSYLREVATLNALYEKTTLTETEKINFEQFKKLCRTISQNYRTGDQTAVLLTARDAEKTLQTLSSIQVEEGKNKLDEVLDMTYFTNLFSYLELVILIVIAVIIQALVFASKTIRGIKKPSNE